MIIYKITNTINSKVYIGQTTKSLQERKSTHYNSMISGTSTHLYNAMRKHGWDNFIFEVIDEATTQEELDRLECYYIEKYDSISSGYNMIPGGRANPMDTPEVAAKHRSKMQTSEVRDKIRNTIKFQLAAQGGRSQAYRDKMSKIRKELYASDRGEEIKAKFRNSFKFSPEHFRAINDAKNKSVYCIDTEGNIVAEFKRVKDAANWWWLNGYSHVKSPDQLSDRIKESYRCDKYILGLKWIYRV